MKILVFSGIVAIPRQNSWSFSFSQPSFAVPVMIFFSYSSNLHDETE